MSEIAKGIVFRLLTSGVRYEWSLERVFASATNGWRASGASGALWFARHHDEILICAHGTSRESGLLETALRTSLDGEQLFDLRTQEPVPEYGVFESDERLRLAERFFALDSALCLAWLRVEASLPQPAVRREFSIVLTDALVRHLGWSRAEREQFYYLGWRWAVEDGSWHDTDVALMQERAEAQRVALVSLLADPIASLRQPRFGVGIDRLVTQFLTDAEPVLAELLTSAQSPVVIFWSLMHRHCNRLGIPGLGEAVVRYLVYHCVQAEAK